MYMKFLKIYYHAWICGDVSVIFLITSVWTIKHHGKFSTWLHQFHCWGNFILARFGGFFLNKSLLHFLIGHIKCKLFLGSILICLYLFQHATFFCRTGIVPAVVKTLQLDYNRIMQIQKFNSSSFFYNVVSFLLPVESLLASDSLKQI